MKVLFQFYFLYVLRKFLLPSFAKSTEVESFVSIVVVTVYSCLDVRKSVVFAAQHHADRNLTQSFKNLVADRLIEQSRFRILTINHIFCFSKRCLCTWRLKTTKWFW